MIILPRFTMKRIEQVVALRFNIPEAYLQSPARARKIARPRQVAMFLCRELTTRSFPQIGRYFGGRDHTTVMHACRRVGKLCAAHPGFAQEVEGCRELLAYVPADVTEQEAA